MKPYRTSDTKRQFSPCGIVTFLTIVATCNFAGAQGNSAGTTEKSGVTSPTGKSQKATKGAVDDTPTNVLSPAEWKRVDAAVERALTWMASQQQQDGSF